MKQTRCKHMTFIGLPLVLLGILICLQAMALELSAGPAVAAQADDGSVLPFPPVPSASIAKPRLQDSVHKRRAQPQHLKPGAPNVLIILLDDVGFAQASTFGGEIKTPTLSGWPTRASATTPSTPRPSARPPAPRCSQAATTSGSATARSRNAQWTGTATPA